MAAICQSNIFTTNSQDFHNLFIRYSQETNCRRHVFHFASTRQNVVEAGRGIGTVWRPFVSVRDSTVDQLVVVIEPASSISQWVLGSPLMVRMRFVAPGVRANVGRAGAGIIGSSLKSGMPSASVSFKSSIESSHGSFFLDRN